MSSRACRARGASSDSFDDPDLLAGLWQEAPFARLPPDAPPELFDYVQDIENPSRVYAVHRASRRHGFQLLVERYIIQLRNGCGQSNCVTATCFTCRKRLAGKAPIRRYNSTSARTLAVYLASQDNPQDGLCPTLRQNKGIPTSACSGALLFSKPPSLASHSTPKHSVTRGTSLQPMDKPAAAPRRRHSSHSPRTRPAATSELHNTHGARERGHTGQASVGPSTNPSQSGVEVIERVVNKDHRSFAANLFETFAIKMLEWLTPRGLDSMARQVLTPDDEIGDSVNQTQTSQSGPVSSPITGRNIRPQSKPVPSHSGASNDEEWGVEVEALSHSEAVLDSSPAKGTRFDQTSKTKSRTSCSSQPKRTMSTEPFSSPTMVEDPRSTVLAPRFNGFQRDKPVRPSKANVSVTGRGIPEMPSKPAFFEHVSSPNPQSSQQRATLQASSQDASSKEEAGKRNSVQSRNKIPLRHTIEEDVDQTTSEIPTDWLNKALPQTLKHFDVEVVDFICDVFQEDKTSEEQHLSQIELGEMRARSANKPKALSRRSTYRSNSLKKHWKDFNEQTIFCILSDPRSVVQSFTRNGQLYDSQTLWYCLRRLNQVAPSLVFHSLWVAIGSLLTPQVPLQTLQSEDAIPKPRRRSSPKLTEAEAGSLLSICLHALVAAAPVFSDSRTLYEMSRIRSNGLVLAGGGSVARQPSSRCLEYNDAFSHELAIRLARRIFCSINAHRFLGQISRQKGVLTTSGARPDILRPLINQLDFLNTGNPPVLEFAHPERLLHETRVPTILLDWARTILLMEWDGRPDVSLHGAFGGALSFIETMYDSRNLLLLGDVQFRVDFLSDRLDSIETPVQWLAFKSNNRKRHILDYPYIFSPDTLVSFFRSINFARMSRMFEESSSLKTRMSAIVDPGSLITNPHHKMVLQDLLRTASSKYLILEIGRASVVRDAFDQLWRREERELLRPLKVHLGEEGGEEGFDSGGVQQEFFRLAIAECLDPSYGAFAIDDRTRMAWFVPGSVIEDWKFELVGLLVSLALYNGLTLPITFPRALYRKLLGKPVKEIHHIADGWPDLASGLTTLLEWDEKDGLVEDVFARTYEFSVSAFGSNITREMMRNGVPWPPAITTSDRVMPPHVENKEDAPLVTNDNRDAYVHDYIHYLTDVSVRPQFDAFQRGFQVCLDPKSLSLLTPPILQSLVEGVQEIDISELRRYARYVGWDASHRTIKDFWSIVRRYDDRMKRRLLEFVTSSDRVPVGGMKNLQFVIQKNGEEGDAGHLPTAYTCYGTLLLPEYKDKDSLKERLGMALENAQGFGFA